MRLRRGRHGYAVDVYDGPLVSRHRPSVDVLFESVAREAGPHGVAVVLAGMGGDGAQGTLDVRRSGGLTIAQDEATSVVFGMPKEAIESGGVEYVVSLSRIPEAILGATRPHPEGPAADSNQDRG
jgi:two-component system chemotaxis response regulator CheB